MASSPYAYLQVRVKVTGSRMDATVLGYDEPAKKLIAVTAKSISAAAAGPLY